MKSHFIAISILLAVGCRQCASVPNLVDPLGIYLSRDGLDLSSAAYISSPGQPTIDAAYRAAFPIEDQLIVSSNVPGTQPLLDFLRKISNTIKTSLQSGISFLISILSIPWSIIKFLLSPITLMFNITKFLLKLFFLPAIIIWRTTKMLLYPITYTLDILTRSNPPPSYVTGLPAQISYNPPTYSL